MILLKQIGRDELFIQLATLVHFSTHKLSAKPVVFIDPFQEFLLTDGLQKTGIGWIDAPILGKRVQQSSRHVLKMRPDIEIVQCDSICTVQIKVIEHKTGRLHHNLHLFQSIVQLQTSARLCRTSTFECLYIHWNLLGIFAPLVLEKGVVKSQNSRESFKIFCKKRT